MTDGPLLEIEHLHLAKRSSHQESESKVLDDVSLSILAGQTHCVLADSEEHGSALAAALLGGPDHEVTGGAIRLRGDDITHWATDVRAKAGLFLAFQRPPELAGISVLALVRQALGARTGVAVDVSQLQSSLRSWVVRLQLDPRVLEAGPAEPPVEPAAEPGTAEHPAEHPVEHAAEDDVGADSGDWELVIGGELLQLALLQPELAVIGLGSAPNDIRGQRLLGDGLRVIRAERPTLGTLAITHDHRLLEHLQPDHLHLLVGDRIVASGGPELAHKLETEGYGSFK